MKLHTTINFNSQNDKVQSKIFKLQIIYKIDGQKSSLEKDIDVADYYKKLNDNFTIKILNKPQTQLKYRVGVYFKDDIDKNKSKIDTDQPQRPQKKSPYKVQTKLKGTPDQSNSKSILKAVLPTNKSLKVIRFQDDKQDTHSNFAERKVDKKHNTLNLAENSQQNSHRGMKSPIVSEQNNQNSPQLKDNQIRKFEGKVNSLEKQLQLKEQSLSKINIKYKQLETKYKELGNKYQQLNTKYLHEKERTQRGNQRKLEIDDTKLEQFEEKMKEIRSELKNYKEKCEKLEKQCERHKQQNKENSFGSEEKENEVKRLQSQAKSLNEQIKKYQSNLKSLKQENRQLQELLLEVEGKSKLNNGKSLEDSLKPYKERIKMLERQSQDLQEQKNFSQKQNRTKNEEILDLKQKMKTLNEENLHHLQDLSNKQYELQKLNKKLKDLENQQKNISKTKNSQEEEDQQSQIQDNYSNKFKSEKVIKDSNEARNASKLKSQNAQLKMKLQIALKDLENKKTLLQKFQSFSKEDKKEIEEQLQIVKKQNISLKQKLSSLEKGSSGGKGNNELAQLQFKMQLEKVKKELQYKTKSQRQLLIDKSQLQTRNKALQQDVVKSKESMANILNAIHEFGDEGLIQDVNMFLG